MSEKKDQYTLIEQATLCSSYGPIDLLVIACCINKIYAILTYCTTVKL